MQFNVPQFIELEDRIVGPLTAKQLGWLALGGVFLLVLWKFLDTTAFFIAAILVGIIFGGLAFYRPNNQPLVSFITSSILFIFKPKVYLWKRIPEKMKLEKIYRKDDQKNIKKKSINPQKIETIAKLLDKK